MRTPDEIRRGFALILLLAVVSIALPAGVLHVMGYGAIASFVGLAGMGGMFATLTLGLRGGLIAAVALGIGSALLVLTSTTWWAAALVMASVALLYGLSARRGWQVGFIWCAVALSFVAPVGAKALRLVELDAFVLGLAFLVWAAVTSGLTFLVFRQPVLPTSPASRRAVLGYVITLVVVTFATESLAIGRDLGVTGAWLVMTPFLVIMPSIHDGFRKSVQRAAGTIVGFVLVIGLTIVTTSHPLFYAIGTLSFTAAIYAKFKKWNYFSFSLFVTPAIVIMEGISSSITTEAEYRLEATLGAVAISLAAMGIMEIVNRLTTPRAS